MNGMVIFTRTAAPAKVVSNTATQLVVVIPTGAENGPIRIKTASGTAVNFSYAVKTIPE